MTLQVKPTQTQMAIIPTYTAPVVLASPMPTPFPPNTPVWSVYNYTCEFAEGGGTMTMELTWTDRSDTEESYKVYRNEQEITTLEPNSTYYVDVTSKPSIRTGKQAPAQSPMVASDGKH
jgi:hypothetical protein